LFGVVFGQALQGQNYSTDIIVINSQMTQNY